MDPFPGHAVPGVFRVWHRIIVVACSVPYLVVCVEVDSLSFALVDSNAVVGSAVLTVERNVTAQAFNLQLNYIEKHQIYMI